MKFVGIKWHNQRKKPYLEFKRTGTEKSAYFEVKPDNDISISIDSKKTCTGHYSDPDYLYVDCPTDSAQLYSQTQCNSCYQEDSALFLPLHLLKDSQKSRVKQQMHSTYLNLFGPDLIKIGVAAEIRKVTRVLEQGAHSTLFISQSDGITARKIEEYLSTQLKLPQQVHSTTKLSLVNHKKSPEDAQRVLEEILEKIWQVLPPEMEEYFEQKPEFHYNIPYYGNINFSDNLVCQNIIDLEKPAIISGKILGTAGELLFIRDSYQRVISLNTKMIKGFESNASSTLSESTNEKIKTKPVKLVSPERNLSLF